MFNTIVASTAKTCLATNKEIIPCANSNISTDGRVVVLENQESYTKGLQAVNNSESSVYYRQVTTCHNDLDSAIQLKPKNRAGYRKSAVKFINNLTKNLGEHFLADFSPRKRLEYLLTVTSASGRIKTSDIQFFIGHFEHNLDNYDNNSKRCIRQLLDSTTDSQIIKQGYLYSSALWYSKEIHFDALSLALLFDFTISSNKDINENAVSPFINHITAKFFQNTGVDPLVICNLPRNQFKFICEFNNLLANNIIYQVWHKNFVSLDITPDILMTHISYLWAEVIPKILPKPDVATSYSNPIEWFSARTKEILLSDFITTTLIACIQKTKENSNPISNYQESVVTLFGDEFEYNSNICSTSYQDEHYILDVFYQKLVSHLTSLKVEFTLTNNNQESFSITIGTFKFRIFLDRPNLEITSTPYTIDNKEVVKINQEVKEITRYEAYDMFIFPVVNKLQFTLVSGHKHMDIKKFSPELILRMIVSSSNAYFLPVVYDRHESSESYFPYLSEKNRTIWEMLNNIVKVFNENLASGEFESVTESYSDTAQVCYILSTMDIANKYSPLATHHAKERPKHTPSCEALAESTIEHRILPCARTGKEVRDFNRILTANVEKQQQEQHNQTPINLEQPTSPLSINLEDATELFTGYIQENGLTPEEFKYLVRSKS